MTTSTRHMDLVPCSSDYSSCRVLAWNRECRSGLGIEAPSRRQHLGTLSISVQSSELSNRPILYRSVCFQNLSSIASLLQLKTRPRGPDCRCIFHIMGQGNPLLISPFCLIGRALLKIHREAIEHACLVAPAWPSQIWYSQLLAMLVGLPILLPMEDDLLLSPDQRAHPL